MTYMLFLKPHLNDKLILHYVAVPQCASLISNLGTFGLFLMFNMINSAGKNIFPHETLCLSLMFPGNLGN